MGAPRTDVLATPPGEGKQAFQDAAPPPNYTAMTQTQTDTRLPALSGFFLALPVAAGLAVALAVFAYLCLSSDYRREVESRKADLHSLEIVLANMDSIWERAASFADLAARQFEASDKGRFASVAEQFSTSWPEAGITLYNRSGARILLGSTGGVPETEPLARTARPLVHAALVGQTAKAFTRSRGFLSLTAAVPVRAGEARALLVTVPLDSQTLGVLKSRSHADLGLLALDDGGAPRDNFAEAANTFSLSDDRAAALWAAIGNALPDMQITGPQALSVSTGTVGAAPLEDAMGSVTGLLFAAPLSAEAPDGSLPYNLLAALCAGLLTLLFSGLCLRLYAKRLGAALALAVDALSNGSGDGRAIAPAFPAPLRSVLENVARTFREYRNRVKTAEIERDAAGRKSAVHESSVVAHAEDDDYLRLFENAPVGIFQAEANGRFLRVNQAFAMLLGYDTPHMLLADNPSFTGLCLYGDEIRNPLNALIEQGGGRQALSLRKRGGGIGNYALLSVPLPSATGDISTILEGYLVDRDLEEQTARAERDKESANRQRTSLALLLAATCLQTQSNLLQPQLADAEAADKAGAPPLAGPADQAAGQEDEQRTPSQERRKSVLAVKAVLSDIYQIAMTEASASSPVDLPIDFGRFLRRLCRQALPAMHLRGISLRCEVADELLGRLTGPAPLLRHALHRALLAVTAPVRGGWANLSVMRDPNAPRSPGHSRVLFSASWSSFEREPGKAGYLSPDDELLFASQGLSQLFNAPADSDVLSTTQLELDPVTLELGAEQEVIRYLAQKMRGDLLEGMFTNDVRSLQLIVPLNHMEGLAQQADGDAAEPAPLPSDAAGASLIPPPARGIDAYSDISMSVLPADAPAPLNILVADEMDVAALEDPAREDEHGLDILLVDDSLNNRLLFSLFLKDTRHRITEAHDGQEGVEAFQRKHFDVIFMDMEMPLMDGYQATRIIRALEADNDRAPTPIVGMTSYALPEFRRQCMLSGCSDFLSKPFSKIALFSILDAFKQLKEDGEHEE